MTAHDFARQLLAGPDLPLVFTHADGEPTLTPILASVDGRTVETLLIQPADEINWLDIAWARLMVNPRMIAVEFDRDEWLELLRTVQALHAHVRHVRVQVEDLAIEPLHQRSGTVRAILREAHRRWLAAAADRADARAAAAEPGAIPWDDLKAENGL